MIFWISASFLDPKGKSFSVRSHTKNELMDPDIYPGIVLTRIELTSTASNISLHIVHDRLQRWIIWNDIIVEQQVGFRKDNCAIGSTFILHGTIDSV